LNRTMNIAIKDLLDAGLHFGHQVKRWNPKCKSFLFDHIHGISIINLEQTYELLASAAQFVEDIVTGGGKVLFVGTKKQAQDIIREAAVSVQMPFCVNRWMGGTLTNFQTVTTSLQKYKKYLQMEDDGSLDKLPGKEAAAIKHQMSRMHRNFEGLLEVGDLPSAVFVIDVRHEEISVREAHRLNIPCIGLVDTNSDPSLVSHPIPGNDDASKSIRIVTEVIVEAVQNGKARQATQQVQSGITPLIRAEFGEDQDDLEVTLPEGYEEIVEREQFSAFKKPIAGKASAEPETKVSSAEGKAPPDAEEDSAAAGEAAPAELDSSEPGVESTKVSEVSAEEEEASAEEEESSAVEDSAIEGEAAPMKEDLSELGTEPAEASESPSEEEEVPAEEEEPPNVEEDSVVEGEDVPAEEDSPALETPSVEEAGSLGEPELAKESEAKSEET